VEHFFYTLTERTEKTWKSEAKSFLKESYIGSIRLAFITGFSLLEKGIQKKSGDNSYPQGYSVIGVGCVKSLVQLI
jgi:hypothetical protein